MTNLMTVAVLVTANAQQDIEGLPAVVKVRVLKKFEELRTYPQVSGVKALQGNLRGKYRVRVGSYRIVFTLPDAASLLVVAVADRKDVY